MNGHSHERAGRRADRGSVAASVLASIVTTVVVFLLMRALDERGVLPFGGRHAGDGESADVPSLVGMQPDQAREILKGRGLLFTLSGERESATAPTGTVAEQSPLPGSQVHKGSIVQAALSRGAKRIAVPALVGARGDESLRLLVAAGLVGGPQRQVAHDTAPAGTVIETQPPPGSLLPPQGTVTLVVSTGPAQKPAPTLTGLRNKAARELLEKEGFKVGKVRWDDDGDRPGGIVLSQKPPAGTPATLGTAFDFVVNQD